MSLLQKMEETIPALRRYAWALLRNESDADDLVQDCLLRAIDRLDTLRTDAELRPWMFTIMHNLYVSRWRRKRRQAAPLVELENSGWCYPGPHDRRGIRLDCAWPRCSDRCRFGRHGSYGHVPCVCCRRHASG